MTEVDNLAFVLTTNTASAFHGNQIMPTTSKSPITTKTISIKGRRLPKERPPTHPGEMLLEEFLKPEGITQNEILDAFRTRAESAGSGYQTMINQALKEHL